MINPSRLFGGTLPANNHKQKPSPESPAQDARDQYAASLHTMKSDMDEFLRSGKPSIAQMIGVSGPVSPRARTQKRAAFAYIVLGILTVMLIVGGGSAYYFGLLNGLLGLSRTAGPDEPPQRPVSPAPYFSTESSRTISVSASTRPQFFNLMEDSMKEVEREKTIKRLLITYEDEKGERFISVPEFLQLYGIEPPSNFAKRVVDFPFMSFVYYGADGSRFGFAVRTKDRERTIRDFLDWEDHILNDFRPFFFNNRVDSPPLAIFEDRAYRNIDWRYLKLSHDKDIGLAYTVFPAGNVLVFATGKGAMEAVIERLFQ